MTEHDGGPAFLPVPLRDYFAVTVNVTYDDDMIDGISPRTWESVFGKQPDSKENPLAFLEYWARVDAGWRYMRADAMLAERERK